MGRADCKEVCRSCGNIAFSSIYIEEAGLLTRKVMCLDCQESLGLRKKEMPIKCPSCGGRRFSYNEDKSRMYCESGGCNAMIMI